MPSSPFSPVKQHRPERRTPLGANLLRRCARRCAYIAYTTLLSYSANQHRISVRHHDCTRLFPFRSYLLFFITKHGRLLSFGLFIYYAPLLFGLELRRAARAKTDMAMDMGWTRLDITIRGLRLNWTTRRLGLFWGFCSGSLLVWFGLRGFWLFRDNSGWPS